MAPIRRRTLPGAFGAGAAVLAGCIASGNADTPTGVTRNDRGDGTERPATTTETHEPMEDTDDGTNATTELDLREANVTGVAVRREGEGYVFDVALYHDDDGEDGYANWWQIETLDGDRIGRRDLAHAHGTREFTRSNYEPYAVPEGTDCVVVRGHDETHGYGGQAALVGLDGTVKLVRQGSEPESFSAADCP